MKATIEHEIVTNVFDYAKHFPNSPRIQRAAPKGMPLRAALLAYCDTLATQLQPETVYEYRQDCEIIAAGIGKDKPIHAITRAEIRLWVSKLNLTKKRIDNILIPFRGALNQAIEDGKIEASPLAGFRVKRIEGPRQAIDPFTPEEVESLSGTDLGDLWQFWAWSGLRTGEIIGLEWGDVGLGCKSITVRRAVRVGRTKSPKTSAGARVVHLVEPARRALADIQQGAPGAVFRNPNTGERWHEDRGLARAFRKACKACGVRYRYPYQLRHTWATWALSSGENPAWIAKQMGHSDTLMLFRVYGKWMPSMDPTAGSKMVKAAKSKGNIRAA